MENCLYCDSMRLSSHLRHRWQQHPDQVGPSIELNACQLVSIHWHKQSSMQVSGLLQSTVVDILSKNTILQVFRPAPLVYVIKLFWSKSRKSRLPPKLKQQEQSILKGINILNLQFYIKIALFQHFSACSISRTNFIHFLILGKSRFPP